LATQVSSISRLSSQAPPAPLRVFVCTNDLAARRVAARNPGAVVVDLRERRIIRGRTAIGFGSRRGGRRKLFGFCLALLLRQGEFATQGELFEALWGDDEDGGPLHLRTVLAMYCTEARAALASLGLGVEATRKLGRRVVDLRAAETIRAWREAA
jgi:hypothetical protein